MGENGLLIKVGKGALRSTIITVLLLIAFAVVMTMKEVSTQVMSVYYLIVSCISIIYGSIYAARKHNRKGWIVGLLVAVMYMFVIYLVSAVFFQDASFTSKDLIRIIIALFVGILSGMLGINL